MCSSLFLMTSPSIPRNPAYDPIAHDRNDVWNRKAASSLSRWGNEHPPPSRAHSYNSSLCVSPTSIRPQGKGAAQCHWVLNSCEITEFYFQFLPSGIMHRGFPGGSDSKKKKKKKSSCNAGDLGLIPGKIPWRRAWQPAPVFLPGESHGWRNLAGDSP